MTDETPVIEDDEEEFLTFDQRTIDRRYHSRRGDAIYCSQYYGRMLFEEPERIITQYVEFMSQKDAPQHDTLIGTGISGGLSAALLAVATGKMYAVLRKDNARSHSSMPLEGHVGRRWIFVDDFICSGATGRRVKNAVTKYVPRTEFVGTWLFRESRFHAAPPPLRVAPDLNEGSEPVLKLNELPQDSLGPGEWCALESGEVVARGEITIPAIKARSAQRTFPSVIETELARQLVLERYMMTPKVTSKPSKKGDENL